MYFILKNEIHVLNSIKWSIRQSTTTTTATLEMKLFSIVAVQFVNVKLF